MKKIWIAVANAREMAPETARVVHAGGRAIALVVTPEGYFALDNLCPHSGGPLGEGLVQGARLTCPLHGWQFDCKTGTCLSEKRPNQRRYPVKIEKDQVWVEVADTPQPTAEPESPASGEWTAVAEVKDLAPGTVRTIQTKQGTLALVCSQEGLYAVADACPHEGASLGEGSVEGTAVTCPWHGYKFDCKTGKGLTETRLSVRTYETKIEHGHACVRMASASAPPQDSDDPSKKKSPAEIWKAAKHGIDMWPDILRLAKERTPMNAIEEADLERMKWYGYFYRKNNDNDRYMCRIRIPGCELTTEQARTIAFVAYESGYSIVDVTTRGNVQVQGLSIEKLPGVRAALDEVELTSRQSGHDNVRNITSHPFSGIDPEEVIDTRELCRRIQDLVIGSREFSDLPRKFNIALTGRSDPAAHAWTQDISYVATRGPDREAGFQFLIGGNQGQAPKLAWHIPVFIRPEQVVEVTAATLRTFRELGSRHNRHQVRFRFLIERIGPHQVLAEIEKRLGYPLERLSKPAPSPSQGENFIGWFKQKQHDLWAVGVCIPVGRLTWDQFDGLAVVAKQYGWGKLRTTYDQNVVIPGIPSAHRQAVGHAIARQGLTFEPDPITRNMVACTGKQFCNIAVTETKGYAYQLIEALRRRHVQLHGIHVQMSGCPSSCAMSYTADIGLKGGKVRRGSRVLDAFDVYLGGGISNRVQMGVPYKKLVPVDQLPALIENVIRTFYTDRNDSESFSQYWQKRLEGHKAEPSTDQIPTWRCSRCGHMHVAEDPPPFCPVCAALRAKFEPADEVEPASSPTAAPQKPIATNGDGHVRTSPMRWTCRSCAFKHAGDQAPELCPVCGAKNTDFQIEGSFTTVVTPRTRPEGKRILIVGGSIGGHTAAQTARELDPSAQITILTDERHSFYNRLNLTRFLSEEVQRADLFDFTPEWYEENRIVPLTGSRVIGIDPIKKEALLSEGRTLSYDACILTHGSSANTPRFYRSDLSGVYLVRTLEDVDGIMACTRPGVKAAVIGGGVLGLETAYGLVKRGACVKIFEYLPQLMPRQLDTAGAALFMEMVREKGIDPYVGVGVQEILGNGHVEGLQLVDNQKFEADLVIVSTGIKPNTDWVKRSGIHCHHGVVVDDRMQTSADGVFAAGDVAEWNEQVIGLWTNAIEQAKVAATNAVGKIAFFQGFLPVTILKCMGIPLVSIGDIKDGGDGMTSRTRLDPRARTYRRVICRNGFPVGGILLGTLSGMGEMRKLIENGRELEELQRKVVPDEVLAAT